MYKKIVCLDPWNMIDHIMMLGLVSRPFSPFPPMNTMISNA